jgi:dipeptidyl aminopeptidase/acylaminoacyl peptidase
MNRLTLSTILAAAFLCATPGHAQTKRPMTFEDLMALKRVSDPQISPSGKWVLFSVTDVSLAANSKTNHLWVVPIAGGPERPIGLPDNATNGRFSPDGSAISYTWADPQDGHSEIYLAGWNEAEGTVTSPRQLTFVSTDADGAIWSPDSKRLLFVSSVYPECSDHPAWKDEDACNKQKDEAAAKDPVKAQIWDHLLYRHWNAFTGEKRSHILVVSATDGAQIRDLTPRTAVGDAETPTFSLGGPLGYAWSPASEEIAYVTNLDKVPAASTNNDVFTLLLDDPAAKPRKISTSPGSDDAPSYSPDGKYIAFRSQKRAGFESDKFRLMVFDRLKGTTVDLLPKLDRWVDEFTWTPDSHNILFAEGNEGEEPYGIVSVEEHTPGYYEHRIRLDERGEFSDLHALPDLTIVATRMLVNHPSEVVIIPPQSYGANGEKAGPQTLRVLTHFDKPLLDSMELSPLEPFWFTGAENTKVQGFLIKPPFFDPTKKYPLKFLIHGGPQGAWGDAWSYRWNPELMAASGYVVLMINSRGSTGYGQKFVDEISGDWGGKPYIDLMKGLDAAEAKYPFIDKSRECALGASYGGYMANWILTHTTRFQCIVTHDGMFNPAAAYGDTEELWFNEWEFRRASDFSEKTGSPAQPWRYAAGPIADDPFRKWSPMLHIADAKTPTLIIHSQKDYRLDVSEGFQLFTALQRLGVPSKMLYFPDEGHWVLKPKNSELWNKTVSDWCDRWTHTNAYAPK